MSKQRLYFLDVGQGMCTYFEEYDDMDQVVANGIFDLGSTKGSRIAGQPTVEFLVERILDRDITDDGRLDAVFVSHKDADHVNLFWRLLDELPDMEIGDVYHSGRREWYLSSRGNIINALGRRTNDPNTCVHNFTVGSSSFHAQPFRPFWSPTTDARAFLIAVNTSSATGNIGRNVTTVYNGSLPNGDLANSTSLGVYLRMFNVGAVIFGDATFSTFQFVNQVFANLGPNTRLPAVFTLQAPHHGSRLTTFGLPSTNATISVAASAVVNTFAAVANSKTVVVSADTSHCHPSLETIHTFVRYADPVAWWQDATIAPYHFTSVYFDLPLSTTQAAPFRNVTYQTGQNFFTTLYYAKNTIKWNYSYPPQGAAAAATGPSTEGMNWMYEIDANSTVAPNNIPLAGIPSNRLPRGRRNLDALFAEAHAARARQQQEQQQASEAAPPPTPGTSPARPPATAQPRLRGLKARP